MVVGADLNFIPSWELDVSQGTHRNIMTSFLGDSSSLSEVWCGFHYKV